MREGENLEGKVAQVMHQMALKKSILKKKYMIEEMKESGDVRVRLFEQFRHGQHSQQQVTKCCSGSNICFSL